MFVAALSMLPHSAMATETELNANDGGSVDAGEFDVPAIRYWWTEDANKNGEYNYSTTAMSGGSTLNVANQYGDVVIADYMTGPFGNTPIPAINMNFHHDGTGYAEANLTTSVANDGHEPLDFADRDAGKAIA